MPNHLYVLFYKSSQQPDEAGPPFCWWGNGGFGGHHGLPEVLQLVGWDASPDWSPDLTPKLILITTPHIQYVLLFPLKGKLVF